MVSRVVFEMAALGNNSPGKVAYKMNAVRQSFVGYSNLGYAKLCYRIGTPPSVVTDCCRSCFKHFYRIGDTQLTEYCKLIKADKEVAPVYTDSAPPYVYGEFFKNSMDDAARRVGITLNHRQIAAAQIPNTEKVNICVFIYVNK